MRKILKGIILSLIIIGLIKTFNEYNINFEDLNPSDFF